MTPTQCRMARAATGWGVRDLAQKAEVSPQTISRLESGEELKDATLSKIRQTIEAAGLKLIEPDSLGGEGVRLAKGPKRGKRRA